MTKIPYKPARLPWLPREPDQPQTRHPEGGQGSGDPLLKIEEALALALEAVIREGRLDLVAGIVAELGERRRERQAKEGQHPKEPKHPGAA